MKQSNQIPLLLTIAAIVFCSCDSIHAQDSTAPSNTRHILILNNKYDPFKEINIGDEVRLILKNSTRVKGHITSIDSTFFAVETNVVHLDEIVSISTKNKKTQIIVGGALLAGAIASFVIVGTGEEMSIGAAQGTYGLGLGLTVAAVATMLPNYHDINKSKRWLMVISNKPSD